MVTELTLYRPTGPEELELVRQSGMKRFPPRLPQQPIFYPVLTEEYAAKIASGWNVRESGSGFVLRFRVPVSVLRKWPAQLAGGLEHQELWVLAEELEAFNDAIIGEIEVIKEFP